MVFIKIFIEREIVKANEKMTASKKELIVAKGMRKNKEEYELLAKMIEKIPSRPETTRFFQFSLRNCSGIFFLFRKINPLEIVHFFLRRLHS